MSGDHKLNTEPLLKLFPQLRPMSKQTMCSIHWSTDHGFPSTSFCVHVKYYHHRVHTDPTTPTHRKRNRWKIYKGTCFIFFTFSFSLIHVMKNIAHSLTCARRFCWPFLGNLKGVLSLWESTLSNRMKYFFHMTYITVLMPASCWNIWRLQPMMRALRTAGVFNICHNIGFWPDIRDRKKWLVTF